MRHVPWLDERRIASMHARLLFVVDDFWLLVILHLLVLLVLDFFLGQSVSQKGIELRILTAFSGSSAESLIELLEVESLS